MATPIVVPGSMPTMMYLRNFADEYAIINIYFILSLSYVNMNLKIINVAAKSNCSGDYSGERTEGY